MALISGGGSGIGLTITEVLARHGCDTAIIGRNKEKLETAAAKVVKLTGESYKIKELEVYILKKW